MDLGRMWSWVPKIPGRIPRRARNTASGEPMQKKFSTCSAGGRADVTRQAPAPGVWLLNPALFNVFL